MGRKWRVRCLLAAVPGCRLSVWVWAAGFTVYGIKPLQLEISLPEDYWVSFYDPSDPDTWPEVSGLSQEQLEAYLKDMGVYLSAASPDRMTEVWVEMEEGSTADYTQVREEDFYLLLSQMEALYEDEEVEYLGAELYRHPQTPFLQVDTRQTVGNLDLYTRLYHTVYGGNSLDFYFRFLTDSLTARQADFTQEVMDSVSFCGEAGQTLAEENSFQDEKTGAVLFVPEGWEAQDIQTESAYLTVRFLPEEAGTAGMILYSSFDLPGSEALEKDGRDRTEVGHSQFTPQEVAQLLGQEEGEIAQVTCGEMEYCQIQSEFTATLEGIAMTAPVTTLARIDDGYLYVYQFYGDREGAYFDDFLQMAANAVYPGAGQASESGTEALEPPDTSSGGQESNGPVSAGGQDQEAGGGQKTGTQASAASGEEAAPHWPDDSESGKIQPEGEEPASSRAASEQDSPGSGQEKTGTESKPGRGILGFVVTVLTVMVPLALYRYGMRRRPLSRPEAGKVAAAYTLGVWAGMMWLGFPDHRLAVTVAGIVAVGPAFVLLAEKKGAASREHNQPDGTAPVATAPEAGTEVEAPMADGGTERPAKSEGWHTENEEREGPARAAGEETEATPEPAGEAQATEGAVGPAQAAGEKTETAPE